MTKRTDQEWIHQLKQNDTLAVEDLWLLLYQNALTLSRYSLTDYDVMTQESLAHEATLQAYLRLIQSGVYHYNFGCPFSAFCRVVLVNELRRALSRQPAVEEEFNDEQHDLPASTVEVDPSPDLILQKLRPCLDQLPSNEREILESVHLKDEAPQIVADRLKITRNYTNVLAHRARLKVQKCLKKRGYNVSEDLL